MIIQKSLDGKVIAEYNTKTQAAKALSLDESAVRKAIKFNRTVYAIALILIFTLKGLIAAGCKR